MKDGKITTDTKKRTDVHQKKLFYGNYIKPQRYTYRVEKWNETLFSMELD